MILKIGSAEQKKAAGRGEVHGPLAVLCSVCAVVALHTVTSSSRRAIRIGSDNNR
jgi:hypothetical protein